MSKIYLGDNLEILKSKVEDKSIDFIYIDPPFNTGNKQVIHGNSYDDNIENYIEFIVERVREAYRVLKDNGTFCIHVDWRESAYVKVAMDTIFGRQNYLNEIIWAYDYGARQKKKWSTKHDTIHVYVKDINNYVFNYDEMDRIPYMAPGLVGKEKAAKGKTPTDCYSSDTEVLTYDGWKLFSEITINDKLATVSPKKELLYVNPSKLHSYNYEGDMIQFKSKTIDLCVTPNHNMYVRPKGNKEYKFIKANEVKNYRYVNLINNLIWKGEEKEKFSLPSVSYRVQSQGKVVPEFYMEDWCELLGWWIAEGSAIHCADNYVTCISQTKPVYINKLENLLNKIGINWHYNGKDYCIYNKQLISYFQKFGYSYQKEIPKEFLILSTKYLQKLYNGLMMGDGDVRDFDNYFTTSPNLASQIQELLLKLGYNSSLSIYPISNRDHFINGRKIKSNYPKHIVYRRKSKESSIWKKHISKVKYNNMVYCATVEPYHTLVVRRNGRIAVCGNCMWHTIVPTNGKERLGYPTQKPKGILDRLVKVHSPINGKVLDFFAGSGTLGESALSNNRQFILIDNNPQAIEIMKKRFSDKNVCFCTF